jgi:predicted Zn-dependent protease
MRRSVNVKVLLIVLGTILVLGISIHCLHAYQVQLNAGALSRQAQRALEKGQFAQAATYLDRYLALAPGDTEALAQLGQLLDRVADGPEGRFQALQILEQVLRRQPDRRDLRRRVVILAIDQYRFRDAISHLDVLLPDAPDADKGELEHLLGWCQDAEGHPEASAAAFRRAVQYGPERIQSYVLLAEVLKDRLVQPAEAAKTMDAMVAANPRSPQALLARARYLQAANDFDGAARDMAQARELDPARVEVTLAVADLARTRGSLAESRSLLQQGLKQHPQDPRLVASLVDIELLDGRPAEAMSCLRQGIKELPDAADLLILLADLLLDNNEMAEANALIDRIRNIKPPSPRTEYLQARVLMKQNKWEEAVVLLESVRPRLAGVAAWASQVDICLGQCHEKLGEVEQQLAAFRRAVRQNPSAAVGRYGLGVALLAAGNLEEAVAELRRLSTLSKAPPATWSMLARALILRNRLLPEAQRNWQDADIALARAAGATPDEADLTILRAEILAGQQQLDAALVLVAKARDRQPDHVRLWIALADLVGRQGKAGAALEILNQAKQRPALAANLELRLALVRAWAVREGTSAFQELARLAQEVDTLAREDQARFLRALAEAQGRRGELAEAQRLWQHLADQRPQDLPSRFALFEIALARGQDAAAQHILQDIRRLEGEGGVRWRCAEAMRLLSPAKQSDRQRLTAARKVLAEIAAIQKDYPTVPVLEAAIDELERHYESAIAHYRQALERGVQQPRLFYRLTQLLTERRRFTEGDQVVRKAESYGLLSKELARLGAEIALGTRDQARAVQLARQAVPEPSRDYRDMLWLARLLETVGEPYDAERILRALAGKAAAVPDVRAALVGVLARSQRTKDAKAVIEEAKRKLPSDRVALGLARCYEAFGDVNRAEAQYREALQARPADCVLLSAAAEFFRRTDQPRKAEPLLRQLIDPATQAPGDYRVRARRHLALLLAANATDADYQEALALVDQNSKSRGATVDDDRVRAVVLASRPGQRREAIRLFEDSLKDLPIAEEDQFLLAQLWEAEGAWEQAQRLMLDLLATNPENPQYLAFHLRGLIRHGERAGMSFYLDKLERIEPRSARTQDLKALVASKAPPF